MNLNDNFTARLLKVQKLQITVLDKGKKERKETNEFHLTLVLYTILYKTFSQCNDGLCLLSLSSEVFPEHIATRYLDRQFVSIIGNFNMKRE